ncbi:hypothetical protein GCM10011514_22160 [Emticicia aquatilis]|uniref:Uncharacterized protein n=1 Tax=Emticicia aquatilis TaxID=1537369 RepID=A0A917DP66_9BACT|nr:hypothetical protein [Emticicia aquatilis]GGD57630.1 hypothetical protein GCM10011514_22160 [Emticicia aquatilis]
MFNKVFSISGNKISSFIFDENSLKFSSQNFNSYTDFQDAWNKKLSLATKVEIKFENIKSIKKEEFDKDILIKYKALGGLPADCEFSFTNFEDYETFFSFFTEKRYYQRTIETLTPFKAIQNYLIGFVATIGITLFSYFEAIALANGTAEEAHSGKTKTFNFVVELLGDKGVILVGTAISAFLIYKICTRFKNPPNQTRLVPPNS